MLFDGLHFALTGRGKDVRNVRDLIISQGGKILPKETSTIKALIVSSVAPSVKKIALSEALGVPCVTASWVSDSIAVGSIQPVKKYSIENSSIHKCNDSLSADVQPIELILKSTPPTKSSRLNFADRRVIHGSSTKTSNRKIRKNVLLHDECSNTFEARLSQQLDIGHKKHSGVTKNREDFSLSQHSNDPKCMKVITATEFCSRLGQEPKREHSRQCAAPSLFSHEKALQMSRPSAHIPEEPIASPEEQTQRPLRLSTALPVMPSSRCNFNQKIQACSTNPIGKSKYFDREGENHDLKILNTASVKSNVTSRTELYVPPDNFGPNDKKKSAMDAQKVSHLMTGPRKSLISRKPSLRNLNQASSDELAVAELRTSTESDCSVRRNTRKPSPPSVTTNGLEACFPPRPSPYLSRAPPPLPSRLHTRSGYRSQSALEKTRSTAADTTTGSTAPHANVHRDSTRLGFHKPFPSGSYNVNSRADVSSNNRLLTRTATRKPIVLKQTGTGERKKADLQSQGNLARNVLEHPAGRALDPESVAQILLQIVDNALPVTFESISGLEHCKQILRESVILPSKRPELFTGLRRPCAALLLFGPPGNGKTMLAKAIACECKTTFFNISASAIASKWVGDSEKLVRALFGTARALSPSTIFIDEIDSMLQVRGSSNELEGSRRLKTEFLVQMDGAGNDYSQYRVMVMGATNRPYDLDDAVLRRFPKRVMVPLPGCDTRKSMLSNLLKEEKCTFDSGDWEKLSKLTEHYSASDLSQLCKDMALSPIRDLGARALEVEIADLRAINFNDALECLKTIRPSTSTSMLERLATWNQEYGSR